MLEKIDVLFKALPGLIELVKKLEKATGTEKEAIQAELDAKVAEFKPVLEDAVDELAAGLNVLMDNLKDVFGSISDAMKKL